MSKSQFPLLLPITTPFHSTPLVLSHSILISILPQIPSLYIFRQTVLNTGEL